MDQLPGEDGQEEEEEEELLSVSLLTDDTPGVCPGAVDERRLLLAGTGHDPKGHAPIGYTNTGRAPIGYAHTGPAHTEHAPTGYTHTGHAPRMSIGDLSCPLD